MPGERLQLCRYNRGLKALQVIAVATAQEAYRTELVYAVDEAGQAYLESPETPTFEIVNRFGRDPVASSLSRRSGMFLNHSAMVIQSRGKKDEMGTLVLLAEGEDRYNDHHLKLFSMLKEVFDNLFANVNRFDELNQVKELLRIDMDALRCRVLGHPESKVVGKDFGLRRVMELVAEVAPLASPVLLLGETGVGKEVVANAIHNLSPRKKNPFVPVNCGAIPEGLMDSEFFGHERGAFTDARSQRKGYFELADKGSIFLDEIGELPPKAQVRMLRVLQENQIQRVGSNERLNVDVRIIAATHQNLQEMVQDGRFRADLWFRLHVFPIAIPPLRKRKEDIPALVTYFIEKKRKELNLAAPSEFYPGTFDTLVDYDWPGNVRELENVVERALILCKDRPLNFNALVQSGHAVEEVEKSTSEGKLLSLDEYTARYIKRVLEKTNGKIEGPGGAAEILNINHGTLRYRMKKLNIPFGKKRFF
ncbi:MAG: sigma 54-interacting transcriptional regulator [Desulfatitalea sp.]|nr:sigma 54-interacting transcriptional regulator [Desulfatitalea sp.]